MCELIAFAIAGVVISSRAFTHRRWSPRRARIASALGLVVAAGVSGYCAVGLFVLIKDVTGPCDTLPIECEGLSGLEPMVAVLVITCLVFLLFVHVLAGHWHRSLRHGA